MNNPVSDTVERRKRRTLFLLMGLAIGMFAFGFAMVPLYNLLCQVTGVQSVEQRAMIGTNAPLAAATAVTDRWVTVKFDTTIHPDLPWRLEPMQRKLRVRPGRAIS